jgi:hypothetical protein
MRLGVVIAVYGDKSYKVQFQNSAAIGKNKKIANNLKVKLIDNNELIEINGTTAYCIFIERKRIKLVFSLETKIIGDIEKNKNKI